MEPVDLAELFSFGLAFRVAVAVAVREPVRRALDLALGIALVVALAQPFVLAEQQSELVSVGVAVLVAFDLTLGVAQRARCPTSTSCASAFCFHYYCSSI